MLLNFTHLVNKYKLHINGVLHIGAHYGEEIELYKNYLINDIICFEPLPSNFYILENIVGQKAESYNIALGNENKKILMNVETANNGQSSSILNPKLHIQQYPHITFDKKIEVNMLKLDDFMTFHQANGKNKNKSFNFINIDVQGYELEVFKGGKETLKNIDYIISEVNKEYLYEGCCLIQEIDEFLSEYNFSRAETSWDGITWGDAFYIKNK